MISPRFALMLEFCTAFPQVTRNRAGGEHWSQPGLLRCNWRPIGASFDRYGLNPCSSGCLLATLNCSSAGGEPIVTQNKMPKSVAVKIVMATSLRFIDSDRRL